MVCRLLWLFVVVCCAAFAVFACSSLVFAGVDVCGLAFVVVVCCSLCSFIVAGCCYCRLLLFVSVIYCWSVLAVLLSVRLRVGC